MSTDSPGQPRPQTQEDNPDLEQLWSDVLNQLQLTTARQTFDAWLSDTHLVSLDNGAAVIGVKNAYAKDWLENRLADTIHRTLADLLDRDDTQLQFTVIEQPERDAFGVPYNQDVSPDLDAADLIQPLTPGQKLAQGDHYSAHFKPGGAGFLMISHYQNTFWLAYLGGDAYALWQRLADELLATPEKEKNRWTPAQRYSYRKLAGWLSLPHSCYISGCSRECHNSRNHVRDTDRQRDLCCGNHYPDARVKYDRQRRQRCHFWRVGLLQILHAEGLVKVKEIKSPSARKIRSHILEIQCWRLLPPLTPTQVKTLPLDLQKQHKEWFRTWGKGGKIKKSVYDITYEEWLQITEPTLVPLVPGYDAFELDGPYQPDRDFLKLKRRKWEEVEHQEIETHPESHPNASHDSHLSEK